MNPYTCILAATDFSAHARAAVERAALLAAAQGLPLELLHVISPLPLEEIRRAAPDLAADAARRVLVQAGAELDALAADLRAAHGGRVGVLVREGRPAEVITARARETSALAVVGAHGERYARDLFVGSVAQKVVRRARGPVLVVRQSAAGAYRRVLVPVDFSESADLAVEAAVEIGDGAEIHVLHVYEAPFEERLHYAGVDEPTLRRCRDLARIAAEQNMVRLLHGRFRARRPEIRHQLVAGYPPLVIVRRAEALAADLIVMGAQGRSELSYLLLGSVTLHVLLECTVDLLVVEALGAADA